MGQDQNLFARGTRINAQDWFLEIVAQPEFLLVPKSDVVHGTRHEKTAVGCDRCHGMLSKMDRKGVSDKVMVACFGRGHFPEPDGHVMGPRHKGVAIGGKAGDWSHVAIIPFAGSMRLLKVYRQ